MDEKYAWPLIGVVIGWLLNRLGAYSGNVYEKRAKYGRAIAALFLLHDEVSLLMHWLDDMKDQVDSWEEYEKFRSHTMNRHFLTSQSVIDMMDKAFYEVSGVNPMLSLKLISIKKGITFQQNTPLDMIPTLSPELYIKVISEQEVVLEVSKIGINKMVLELARKCGPLMYFRVKKKFESKENSLPELNKIKPWNIKDIKRELEKSAPVS